jgi:DNA-binding response OmpR family regulator
VLLDLQPRLNGLSVIRQLREDSRFECLPIIIMTGYEPEQFRGTAIEAGCDDFLLTPIDFDRLDAILDYFAPIKVAA